MTWTSITGWLSNIRVARTLMMSVLLVAPLVAAAPPVAEPPPDMDFLEFLGSWQTRDGRWVDPLQVEDLPPGELEPESDNRQNRGKKPTNPGKDRRSADPMKESYPLPDEDMRSHGRDR